jgi:hypothetical protein
MVVSFTNYQTAFEGNTKLLDQLVVASAYPDTSLILILTFGQLTWTHWHFNIKLQTAYLKESAILILNMYQPIQDYWLF